MTTPDTARALASREAAYTDGPEGRGEWRACECCDAEVPADRIIDGLCFGCDRTIALDADDAGWNGAL